MSTLITQTLISSWNYLHNCWDESYDDAKESFLNTLNRIRTPANEAIQNGLDFEREVYKCASGEERTPHTKWEDGINAVATRLKGAQTQVSCKSELQLDGNHFVVYGILDALRAGVIYDVKFVNKSFGSVELAGKYLESPQHPTYLFLVPEAREFQYLVSDGKDLYTETYTRADTRPFPDLLKEFIASLKRMNLYDL